jgi:hypothetical protein
LKHFGVSDDPKNAQEDNNDGNASIKQDPANGDGGSLMDLDSDTSQTKNQAQQTQSQQEPQPPAKFKGDGEEEEKDGGEEEEAEEGEGGVHRVREMWERVTDEELECDDCVRVMREETEEGKKVTRNQGRKFVAVFRRKPDPEWV